MDVKRSITVNGNFLLDTNIVIALLANEKPVIEKLTMAEKVFLPCIILLVIPKMVAHGYRVLGNEPTVIIYFTTRT